MATSWRAAPTLSAVAMSMPIARPLGLRRSRPRQASKTSQASCSCVRIKACGRYWQQSPQALQITRTRHLVFHRQRKPSKS